MVLAEVSRGRLGLVAICGEVLAGDGASKRTSGSKFEDDDQALDLGQIEILGRMAMGAVYTT